MKDDLNLLSTGEARRAGRPFCGAVSQPEVVAELVRNGRYRMMPGEGLVARWTGSLAARLRAWLHEHVRIETGRYIAHRRKDGSFAVTDTRNAERTG